MPALRIRRRSFLLVGACLLFVPIVWLAIPTGALFKVPYGTVLLAKDGRLLGAMVAADGQWRMRSDRPVPDRFKQCLLEFEDRHFMEHHGVHFPSLVRAWNQNRQAGRTVSGGSTITMQLARMSGGSRDRNHLRKLYEIFMALRIEAHHSKEEILSLYSSNAPFGANVVGLEAAAWRWFGRSPEQLGWAENALLAVLPNAPARMHPGKGRDALREKRDRLLRRLHAAGRLDDLELSLALEEPLPERPVPLPREAPHLLGSLAHDHGGGTIYTTIDASLQERIRAMADRYALQLKANEVHNAAVLVLDVRTGEVLAYVGNLPSAGKNHAPEVDIIQAPRSTGSLLKPFLYADMLQGGELLPDQLVADLPTHYDGFSPKNFDQRYDGAVTASQALARSLNVPAVRALRTHGIDRSLRTLKGMGLHHIDRSADHYGLSLIVGGAESTLWELTGAYASMARIVLNYSGSGSVDGSVVFPPSVLRANSRQGVSTLPSPPPGGARGAGFPASPLTQITRPAGNEDPSRTDDRSNTRPAITAGAAYHAIKALQQLNRPETQQGWQHFGNEAIAWKTGTSFGHRDAWAIGITDSYAVGVWTGNASGEGRPGLTGTLVAAPLLFEIFGILPNGLGFDPPYDDMQRMAICRASGHRAGMDCSPIDTLWTIREGQRTAPCPYHRMITVDAAGVHRTAHNATSRTVSWFVLPPAMEYYYAQVHPEYRPLPPLNDADVATGAEMEIIYPERGSRIMLPVRLDGRNSDLVAQAAHRDPKETLHWHLDDDYIGSTGGIHQLAMEPSTGTHRLTLTDRYGASVTTIFHVERSRTPTH